MLEKHAAGDHAARPRGKCSACRLERRAAGRVRDPLPWTPVVPIRKKPRPRVALHPSSDRSVHAVGAIAAGVTDAYSASIDALYASGSRPGVVLSDAGAGDAELWLGGAP